MLLLINEVGVLFKNTSKIMVIVDIKLLKIMMKKISMLKPK